MKTTTRGADQILASISKKLAAGQLKSGDKLPAEAKLCQEYNVSRTVVREAIQQLKAIGVVRTITGSGSYITEGGLDGLKNSLEFYSTMTGDQDSWVDLLEMRILLESACVRSIAGNKHNAKTLTKLRAILQDMENNKENPTKFSKLDVEFHKQIITAADNKIYIAILASLENLHLRFAKETYQDDHNSALTERNYNEHRAIMLAIEKQDPDLAERAIKTHLDATMKNLKAFIRQTSK